ncbi:MAG: HNH endonuclease [Arthrobacter sp.]|jgi:hypothetical protein|nr:HNH endonuclease [Arthrobacter sp.]
MLDAQPLKEATLLVRETLAFSPGSWDAAHEDELVDLLGAVADLSRAVDALRVGTAGAVSRRSEGFNRAESFAARLGFRGTKQLLMQAFGVQAPTADLLVSLAQATAPRSGFSAGELPPFRPALAAALKAGELSADQAAAVHRELPHPGAPEAVPGMIAAAEVSLVAEATGGRIDLSRPPLPPSGQRNPDSGASLPTGHDTELGAGPSGRDPLGSLGSLAGQSEHGGHPEQNGAPGQMYGDGAGDRASFGGVFAGEPMPAPRQETPAGPTWDQDPWGGRRMEVHLVRTQAKAWANHIDPDGPEPRYAEQQHQRAFRLQAARGGGYRLSGFAPEAEGALLLTVLDSFTAPGAQRGRAASPERLPHPGAGGQEDPGAAGGPEDRSQDQKNFDALHALVEEHVRSGSTAAGTSASSALVVSVTLSALERALAASEAGLADGQSALAGLDLAALASPRGQAFASSAEDPRGLALATLLSARAARLSRSDEVLPLSALAARLCEDAVGLLVTDDAGSPLAYGRSRRLFSPQQRRVLTVRDGGCRAPACNAPPGWCHAHHVVPWEQGGPSDVTNAVLLCSFHHHEVHRGRLIVLPARGGNGSPAVVSALTARSMASRETMPAPGAQGRGAHGCGSSGRSAQGLASGHRGWTARLTNHSSPPGPVDPAIRTSRANRSGRGRPAVAAAQTALAGHIGHTGRTRSGTKPRGISWRRHDHLILTSQSGNAKRSRSPGPASRPLLRPRR